MTKEQIYSLVRQLLTFAGTIIVARNWADANTTWQVIGSVIAIYGLVLSVIDKIRTGSNPSDLCLGILRHLMMIAGALGIAIKPEYTTEAGSAIMALSSLLWGQREQISQAKVVQMETTIISLKSKTSQAV